MVTNSVYSIYDAVVRASEINAERGYALGRSPNLPIALSVSPLLLADGNIGAQARLNATF